jgi:hypothetical protein
VQSPAFTPNVPIAAGGLSSSFSQEKKKVIITKSNEVIFKTFI